MQIVTHLITFCTCVGTEQLIYFYSILFVYILTTD
nr:MAG TPA: hypothetical protein [Caudoviricetes sp.]